MSTKAQAQAAADKGASPSPDRVLQRKCACGQHTFGGECEGCRSRPASGLSSPADPSGQELPASVDSVLRSSGESLDGATRRSMEDHFGRDFSHVRLHQGTQAARSAAEMKALAFTFGRDVVFGAGRYAPETAAGRSLLVHELAHVAQQAAARSGTLSPFRRGPRVAILEHEAETASRTVLHARGPGSLLRSSFLSGRPSLSTSEAQLSCAVLNVGSLSIQIEYGDIINIPAADYLTAIEGLFASWTGSPPSVIHAGVSALTSDQQQWVLFGMDLLRDNTNAAHGALNRTQAVRRRCRPGACPHLLRALRGYGDQQCLCKELAILRQYLQRHRHRTDPGAADRPPAEPGGACRPRVPPRRIDLLTGQFRFFRCGSSERAAQPGDRHGKGAGAPARSRPTRAAHRADRAVSPPRRHFDGVRLWDGDAVPGAVANHQDLVPRIGPCARPSTLSRQRDRHRVSTDRQRRVHRGPGRPALRQPAFHGGLDPVFQGEVGSRHRFLLPPGAGHHHPLWAGRAEHGADPEDGP